MELDVGITIDVLKHAKNVDKIIFISEWVKKRFFKDLPELSDNKTQVIYHSIDPVKVNVKKKKYIIFVDIIKFL